MPDFLDRFACWLERKNDSRWAGEEHCWLAVIELDLTSAGKRTWSAQQILEKKASTSSLSYEASPSQCRTLYLSFADYATSATASAPELFATMDSL